MSDPAHLSQYSQWAEEWIIRQRSQANQGAATYWQYLGPVSHVCPCIRNINEAKVWKLWLLQSVGSTWVWVKKLSFKQTHVTIVKPYNCASITICILKDSATVLRLLMCCSEWLSAQTVSCIYLSKREDVQGHSRLWFRVLTGSEKYVSYNQQLTLESPFP